MKKVNEKGFTLAELLIVVAIIAILVGVAIPTFTDQLEKAREATDISNLRSAYAQIVTAALESPQTSTTIPVDMKQSRKGWQTESVEIAGADLKSTKAEDPQANSTLKVEYFKATDNADAYITIAGVKVTGVFDTTVDGYILANDTGGKFTNDAAFKAVTETKYTKSDSGFTEAESYGTKTTVYYVKAAFTKAAEYESDVDYYIITTGETEVFEKATITDNKFTDGIDYYTKKS